MGLSGRDAIEAKVRKAERCGRQKACVHMFCGANQCGCVAIWLEDEQTVQLTSPRSGRPGDDVRRMAEAWVGAAKKRRRSSGEGSGGGGHELREVESILAVHTCPPKKEVAVEGYVLAADQQVESRSGLGRKGGSRDVAGFLLADDSALIQVALWGEQAQKWFQKIVEWLVGKCRRLPTHTSGTFPDQQGEECRRGGVATVAV